MADVTLESTEEIIQLVSVSGASAGDITTAIATHNADTTAVHGITDTAALDTVTARNAAILAAQKISINAQTGTTYQLVAGDYAGNILVRCTNASPITLTVPAHATVPNVVGIVVGIEQGGAGVVTIAAAGGVTINSLGSNLALSGQWAQAALINTAENVWSLVGALA